MQRAVTVTSKAWTTGFAIITGILLISLGAYVYHVDPFFHYHKPHVEEYFYPLDNQRSQNNGIIRNFNYDGMITGTSMTENFKTTDAEEYFGGTFIKVPYSGGSYKEINECIASAIRYNPDLKTVVRCLDMTYFYSDKDMVREDLGEYPEYLYDENPFNDVNYLYNRDVIFDRIYNMEKARREEGFAPGITSFDEYSNWTARFTFGKEAVFANGFDPTFPEQNGGISEEERETIKGNIKQNVTDLADANPDITFYYYLPPYSAAWWMDLWRNGSFEKHMEAEELVISLIVSHPNIHLYSFNTLTDFTTDLNNYKDTTHYGEWGNTMILKYMSEDKCRLTEENYRDYLANERSFYSTYDYNLLAN